MLSLSFTPQAINTSIASENVAFTLQVTDDVSGISQCSITVNAPGGISSFSKSLTLYPSQSNSLASTLQSNLTFPQLGPQGNWTVASVSCSDNARNSVTLISYQLLSWGPIVIQQMGSSNAAPPVFYSLKLQPQTIDTSSANQIVSVSIGVRSNVGISYCAVSLQLPSLGTGASISFSGGPSQVINGSIYNGTIRLNGFVSQYTLMGYITLSSISCADALGLATSISGSQLPLMFGALGVNQTGQGDQFPPVISRFSILPSQINTRNSPAYFSVSLLFSGSCFASGNYLS